MGVMQHKFQFLSREMWKLGPGTRSSPRKNQDKKIIHKLFQMVRLKTRYLVCQILHNHVVGSGSSSSGSGGGIAGYRIGAGDLTSALKVCMLRTAICTSMLIEIVFFTGEASDAIWRRGFRCDAVILQGEID